MIAGQRRGIRVFYNRSQCGVGHDETARTTPVEMMGQQSEGIGIAFKMNQVIPLLLAQSGRVQLIPIGLQPLTVSLTEESAYGLLARMTERRVAQIVSQTGCRYDGAQLRYMGISQIGMLFNQHSGAVVS